MLTSRRARISTLPPSARLRRRTPPIPAQDERAGEEVQRCPKSWTRAGGAAGALAGGEKGRCPMSPRKAPQQFGWRGLKWTAGQTPGQTGPLDLVPPYPAAAQGSPRLLQIRAPDHWILAPYGTCAMQATNASAPGWGGWRSPGPGHGLHFLQEIKESKFKLQQPHHQKRLGGTANTLRGFLVLFMISMQIWLWEGAERIQKFQNIFKLQISLIFWAKISANIKNWCK